MQVILADRRIENVSRASSSPSARAATSLFESWHAYYYSIRRRYFLGVLGWSLVVSAAATVVLEMPWSHPARLMQVVFGTAGVAGAASASERVHIGIAFFTIAFSLIIAMLAVGIRPGPFAP